jgi:beta-glucosidase
LQQVGAAEVFAMLKSAFLICGLRFLEVALVVLALAILFPLLLVSAQELAEANAAEATSSGNVPGEEASDKRANALLLQMTLEEKIGQLNQPFLTGALTQTLEGSLRKGEIGSFALVFATDPTTINRAQHLAVEASRQHIPLLFGFDAIHGFRTIFPVPLAMAASWDPPLVEQASSVSAIEARAVGIHWAFAPMADIARDPRWGRIVEGVGEDPYLGSAMVAAQVSGLQGSYIGSANHVIACVKHFAGYGAAEGGRDFDSSYIPETQLWNVYLPPFHAAVKAGVGSVMGAYTDLNDVPANGNRWLLHDVLREQWGFRGFVVSEADGIDLLRAHGFARDAEDAAVRALAAGVNMEMSETDTQDYLHNLANAVKAGRVSTQQIDDVVLPLLQTKIQLGLFEHPYVDEARAQQVLATPEHRSVARLAAERSAVLLRNEGRVLPLGRAAYKKIAVIGPLADSRVDTLGSWVFAENLDETVTVLAGLRTKLGTGVQVEYAQGVQIHRKFPSPFAEFVQKAKAPTAWTQLQEKDEFSKAVNLARGADIAILVLGELQDMSGMLASRSSLELPGKQQELLQDVVATGKPVVLVLMNGRPLDITWASQNVPAILEAWYPGTQGGTAVANLLFGDVNPGGKLPITWPRNVGQLPIYYSHNLTHDPSGQGGRYWNEESTPLYPFGYGLSYSSFSFTNLRLKQPAIKAGQTLELLVDVENTAATIGDCVAQLYIHQQAGSASRPNRELKGFQRLTLAPHEKKTIPFLLGKEELSYWSTAERRWLLEPETFDVWIGADSNAPLHSTFKVTQ